MAPRAQRAEAADQLASITPTDELAAAGLVMAEDDDDGLGEAGGEDLKIAAKILNMKGKGADNRQIPADSYYDTVDQTTADELDAVFLYLHKTNAYTEYNNELSKTERICSSFDRVTGTIEADGRQRPCKGCPDDQWFTTPEGKRSKHCGPVYNVAALDRRTRIPFWLRFKRTSLHPFKQYMQKHHLGRRVVGNKRLNYPLFSFQVTLRGEMTKDGKYALPVIERGKTLSPEEFEACKEAARTVKGNALQLLNAVDSQMQGVEAPDTSFDPESFGGGGEGDGGAGQDFVE